MSYDPIGAMTGGGDGLSGPSTTFTLTLPGGAATGHLAVITAVAFTTTATATVSSGSGGAWDVESGPDLTFTGTNSTTYLWSRVLTAGDIGTAVTVTWSGNPRGLAAGILYPAGTTGNFSYATIGAASTQTSNAVTCQNGSSLVIFETVKINSGGSLSTIDLPSGYTLDKNAATTTGAFTMYRTTVNHKAITSTGSDGAAVFNFSPATNGSHAYTIDVLPANLPPTVTVGSNQDVAPATVVNLTSTATDPDGSISSRAWSFDYPTSGAPALTNGTSANASFTSGSAGSLYILRHTATDNLGATGTATMEVRVPSSSAITTLAGAGSGTATWTNVGGASSEGAALSDASDATYIESSVVTATEQNHRWRLNPSATRTSGTITVRVSQDIAGTMTAKVRLFQGSTQLQEWTITTTTSIADQTVTLSGGTISAITDWGNLFVEVAVTT